MRASLGKLSADVVPAFRAGGHGPTRTVAQLSIPLRLDDLISILYHCPLSGSTLTDADLIRETVLDALVNHGANAIAADKARLAARLAAGHVDRAGLARLATCQRRIAEVFPGEPDPVRSPAKRSPITRRWALPRTAPDPHTRDDHAA